MTFSGSVVANTNFTCAGGSSTSLRSALKPWLVTMWASSMMKILYRSGRGVHLHDVEGAAAVAGELDAAVARAARGVGGPLGAVEAAREDARRRRLPAPPGTGEQVGVADPIGAQRRHQRVGDVLLPDDFAEGLRAVTAVQGDAHP